MKTKIVAILLLVSFIAPSIGGYLWYRNTRNIVRKSVKELLKNSIDESEMVRFAFSEKEYNDLDWKRSDEFVYKGKIYDVVRTEKHDGSFTTICWLDKEETELNDKWARITSRHFGNNPTRKNFEVQVTHFLQNLYAQNSFDIIHPFLHHSLRFYVQPQGEYVVYADHLTPPPQV